MRLSFIVILSFCAVLLEFDVLVIICSILCGDVSWCIVKLLNVVL
jgi:hypothetical protein